MLLSFFIVRDLFAENDYFRNSFISYRLFLFPSILSTFWTHFLHGQFVEFQFKMQKMMMHCIIWQVIITIKMNLFLFDANFYWRH